MTSVILVLLFLIFTHCFKLYLIICFYYFIIKTPTQQKYFDFLLIFYLFILYFTFLIYLYLFPTNTMRSSFILILYI